MSFLAKYLSHFIFGFVAAYFAFAAFVQHQEPETNKVILLIVLCVWVLWIFAKSLLKMIVVVGVLCAIVFAVYYLFNTDKIECKKAGHQWNATAKICEDSGAFAEQAEGYLRNWFKGNVSFEKDVAKAIDATNTHK